jgi:hypothetical protein
MPKYMTDTRSQVQVSDRVRTRTRVKSTALRLDFSRRVMQEHVSRLQRTVVV